MSNMTMMNNATAIQLSMLSRGGVTDDWTIIVMQIAYGVIILCGVLQLIAAIGLFFTKTKKDRTEDKECKKDEEVA